MLDTHRFPLLASVAVMLSLSLGGCDGGDDDGMDAGGDPAASMCETEERADDFTIDLTKMGARHTVSLVEATPAEPIRGDNAWTILVTDADGNPVEGMTVDAGPWMPDHGHGSPVEETVTDLGGGEYSLAPLNLFMAGLWQVTLDLTDADGMTDEVMISVCVE